MNSLTKISAGGLILSLSLPLFAQDFDRSWLSLSFVNAAGEVAASDNINVDVALSLSPDATMSFKFSGSPGYSPDGSALNFIEGFDNNSHGYRWDEYGGYVEGEIVNFVGSFLAWSRGCTTNADAFEILCSGSPYTVYGGNDSTIWTDLIINPGDSIVLNPFVLWPTGGSAEPGIYRRVSPGLDVVFVGYDENGNLLEARHGLAQLGCWSDECQFTRTVSAVPEPSTYVLMLAGLTAVTGAARLRRR